MAPAIEIYFDADEGHLRLDCGEEEFLRLRDLVISGASTGDRLNPLLDGIRSIVIRRTAAVQDASPKRFPRGLKVLLVSLALGVSLAVQVVGVVVVIRLLLGHDW
jgi:hypothetical protein